MSRRHYLWISSACDIGHPTIKDDDMDRAIYTAMAGAKQTMESQTVHANNLANVSKTGFQSDFVTAQSRYIQADGMQHSRATTAAIATETDFSVGALQETGRDLDIAIEGEGYIAVIAKDGSEAYTRAGDLNVNIYGQLVTQQGLQVLGNVGPITIPPAAKTEIGVDGSISIRPLGQGPEAMATVDRIKLVKPEGGSMDKRVDGLMQSKDGNTLVADPQTRVASGFLESSNVNAVSAMTEILSLSRQFELQVKVIKSVDSNSESVMRLLRTS